MVEFIHYNITITTSFAAISYNRTQTVLIPGAINIIAMSNALALHG